ncbi:hypothetical protein CYLTODRAFT_460455 [Cylindrobasidium torrendii FP15055 ss-10]|uniref:Uncharacterized protein n=1 Tax=Cylindrobasidium torrendii FP15055 ss-10 TaxID=1314674 RepID=A0A0D7ARX7_9AGAR|nr:hypothetical protein CYLTODRAFT_460455 [Cylindrobasidium torrendii FP15055 ss-10]
MPATRSSSVVDNAPAPTNPPPAQPIANVRPATAGKPKDKTNKRYTPIPKDMRKSNRGWMDGQRAQVFLPEIPTLVIAKQKGWSSFNEKVIQLQLKYHWCYPYPTKDHEESPHNPADWRQGTSHQLPAMNDSEKQLCANHILEYNKRLRKWLVLQVSKYEKENDIETSRRTSADALTPLFASLKAPRGRSTIQHFLSLCYHNPEYAHHCLKQRVAEEWDARSDQSITRQLPAFRKRVARDVFSKLSSDEQAVIQKLRDEHNKTIRPGADEPLMSTDAPADPDSTTTSKHESRLFQDAVKIVRAAKKLPIILHTLCKVSHKSHPLKYLT